MPEKCSFRESSENFAVGMPDLSFLVTISSGLFPRTRPGSESTVMRMKYPSIGSGLELYLAAERSQKISNLVFSDSNDLLPFFFLQSLELVLSLNWVDGFSPKLMLRPWDMLFLVHVSEIRSCFWVEREIL